MRDPLVARSTIQSKCTRDSIIVHIQGDFLEFQTLKDLENNKFLKTNFIKKLNLIEQI